MITKIIGLALAVAVLIIGSQAQYANAQQQTPRKVILFLIDPLCVDQGFWMQAYPEAYVVCAREDSWKVAHGHYDGFEQYYDVVYVVESFKGVAGQAFYDSTGQHYAFAFHAKEVIDHELLHLECACFATADGKHGSVERGLINGI